jgi:hypothetical protein
MEQNEYLRLTNERDRLSMMLDKGGIPIRYVLDIKQQLSTIRERIKNAHREQYKRGTRSPGQP